MGLHHELEHISYIEKQNEKMLLTDIEEEMQSTYLNRQSIIEDSISLYLFVVSHIDIFLLSMLCVLFFILSTF